jgi:serine/threonine-protein kinase
MLSKVGRLDVLASVGDKALAYFATRAEGDLDDVARLRHAKALRQIGEVRMVEARSAEALAAFTDAHRRMAALAQRHPREGEFLFERAVAESWIGMTHRKVNARAEATEWLQRANQTAAAAVALDPSRLDWQSELSSGRHNLAILRKESGDLDGAHADFLTALPLRERLSAADPASSFLRDRVAEVHSQLSEIADRQGAYAEALQRYTTKAGLLEEIARMEPKNPTWRHRLADTRIMQSDLLVAMGQLQPAAGRLQEAWQLLNELTAYEPANRDWQVSLLVTRLREATLAQKQGDLARAVRLVEEVRPRFEELTTGPAVNRRFAIRLMTAWRLEAQLRAAAGRGDALAAALSAVNLGAKWFADPRAYDADLGACAQSYVVAGELVARAGDGAAARRHWEQALALLTPHLQPDTRDRRLLDPAARAAMLLGRTDEARARIAQLDRLGYIPLDPWPEPARTPEPQPPTR